MADAGIPGLGRALHVGLLDAYRCVDGGQLTPVVVSLAALGDRALAGRPKLLQLRVVLLDPGADLLGRAGGLATGDEIAGGAQRLPAVEAQLVEQAVQALPEGLAPLIQLGFSAGRLLRTLAGGVPGERVLSQ